MAKTKRLIRKNIHKRDYNDLAAFWQRRDYQGILNLPLTHMCGVTVCGRPFSEIAVGLAEGCSEALVASNPIPMLRIAYALIATEENGAFAALMERIRRAVDALPETDEKSTLLGEWHLVDSFRHFPRLAEMLPAVERASTLLTRPSQVITAGEPFFFGTLSVFSMVHVEPGKADEESVLLDRFVSLYGRCTGGQGAGADVQYKASLAYYRGNVREAELLCYKAAYMAEFAREDCLWMGAMYILAEVEIHNNRPEHYRQTLDGMERAATAHPVNASLCAINLDLAKGQLFAMLGQPDRVAAWITNEEFSGLFRRLKTTMGYLDARCCFLRGETAKTIGIVQAWCEGDIGWGLLIPAVLWLYAATAHLNDGERDEALACVKKAAAICLPDGMTLLLSNFYVWLGDLIKEALRGEDPALLKRIQAVYSTYRVGWSGVFIAQMGADATGLLTPREFDVARLASRRIGNREIAEKLGISERTVKFHLTAVYQKLGVKNRAQLAGIMPQ